MVRLRASFLLILISFAAAIAVPATARPAGDRPPVVIIVSLDGFRPDYLDRGVTPNLSALAARGVTAPMRPAFPTKTFPNHWAMVTGVRPDRNGIIGNRMEDPARPGEVFTLASDDPFWWNAASPIWVDAERAGIRTATMFWPGSNVGWGGMRPARPANAPIVGGTRPEDWLQFNGEVTPTQRVNTVLDWLRRPATIRPRLVTAYFESVDTAGHQFGPDDPRTTRAVADADKMIGTLIAGLRDLGQPADLVVVSDHGMAATSSERVIAADTLADPSLYHLVDSGPFAAFAPSQGNEDKLAAALLKPHEHMQCWRKADIPTHLALGRNPRVTPMFCLAEVGWMILPTAPTEPVTGGSHGYDNDAPEMTALFIAAGPHFVQGVKLGKFDNVDVEPLLRDLLGMEPSPDVDGSDAPFRGVLHK
jgi:predicted AlkP superfamily pyrophosphatase or phosphodiesterase